MRKLEYTAKELMLTKRLSARAATAASSRFRVDNTEFMKQPAYDLSTPAARWNMTLAPAAARTQSSLRSRFPSMISTIEPASCAAMT